MKTRGGKRDLTYWKRRNENPRQLGRWGPEHFGKAYSHYTELGESKKAEYYSAQKAKKGKKDSLARKVYLFSGDAKGR